MQRTQHAAVGLVALAALALPVKAADVDKYLPDDTQAVITINVRQILDSPLVKKYAEGKIKEEMSKNGEVQKMLSDLGFDPFTDFSAITLAGPGGPEPDKGLIIIHGKFDRAKIEAKITQVAKGDVDGLKIIKSGDNILYEVKMPEQKQTLFTSLADDHTIVAAPRKDMVVSALGKVSGKTASGVSKELSDVLKKVDAKQSFWIAGLLTDDLLKGPLAGNEQAKEILGKIASLVGGIHVTDDVKIDFTLNTKTTEAAKEISDLLGVGLSQGKDLLKLVGGNKKELAPVEELLDSVKVNVTGKAVNLKGQMSKQVLEKTLR